MQSENFTGDFISSNNEYDNLSWVKARNITLT